MNTTLKNHYYERNNFTIYEATDRTGVELTLEELSIIEKAFKPAQIALTKFINILHSQNDKKFESIMNQYGYEHASMFEATRVFLIQRARKVIDLIGELHLKPQSFYKSSGFGDATYYEKYKIIGFGYTFFNVDNNKRADTVIHEFSHAVWTGEDGIYTPRDAEPHFKRLAIDTLYSKNKKSRAELKNSSYVFEFAVRSVQ